MTLDLQQLSDLFDLLATKGISEFEHEDQGVRIRVSRSAPSGTAGRLPAPTPSLVGAAMPGADASDSAGGDYVDVTSPFVGSFYRAPSPDAPPFVEVGAVVRPGQTLCIIEAMKLMNEIEAECAGTVTEIFAQSGKNVEYGQKLFRIQKA